AGDFKLDADGNLVTSSGDLQVVGENGPINLPHHDVTIDAKGRIISDEDGQVGKIDIYRVDDMQGLAQRPDGLYEAAEGTEDEPEEDGARLVQGCLEKSNASPVELATGLIDIQRAYQAYLNTMKTYSEIGEQAARIGRVG
ncbi:MAG: flagellar basal body rod C-terminal domain-containing protein, partial [Desulfobacterales bacterium]